jgi:hypothetical protein
VATTIVSTHDSRITLAVGWNEILIFVDLRNTKNILSKISKEAFSSPLSHTTFSRCGVSSSLCDGWHFRSHPLHQMKVQSWITKKDSGTVRDELSLTAFDLWALGMTIVIGGQYFGWNAGLAMGFGSFLIAFVLVAFAFMVLSFSLAELSGVVPFGGKN